MSKSIYKGFLGSIDAFLKHCSSLDASKVLNMAENRSNDILSPGEAIAVIMDDLKCSKERAAEIRMEIAMEELTSVQADLHAKGYLELTGYDEDGNATYIPTELGRKQLGLS